MLVRARLVGQRPAATDRLVDRVWRAVGFPVLHHTEVMRADPIPHDVVVRRPLKFDEAQRGASPVNPILAFRIAGHLAARCVPLPAK